MTGEAPASPHRRRPRYAGKNPRRFEEKYKERDPARYAETVAKVLASGKTPAGMHRPIMVAEILEVLHPQPGEIAVDCTLGYGGHAGELLKRVLPGGRLIGLDVDPVELPKTEARLRALGYDETQFVVHRSNFAGLPKILAAVAAVYDRRGSLPADSESGRRSQSAAIGADIILADLGVSSMQLDDPGRGFSMKSDGPLDMRMNPKRGQPVAALLQKINAGKLAALLRENADEPQAETLAGLLAGKTFATTRALAETIRRSGMDDDTVRRVFQALRIAVNEEFSALDTLLRNLPDCLKPGGRVAILTFHSGEDRRVKKSFEAGLQAGSYADIAHEVIRASPAERHDNPRSTSAKLRWVRKAG